MYSAWWIPKGQKSSIATDHDALHRDEETHKAIQSDEAILRPLDMETIMSSKASVKYWYLHRPKTMAVVHQHAVKMQSIGRSFAVRRLIEKHGIHYTVKLAIRDADKREEERQQQLTEEEKALEAIENEKIEARRQERKRMRREIALMENEDEISTSVNPIWNKEAEEIRAERERQRQAELAAIAAAEAEQLRYEEEQRALALEQARQEQMKLEREEQARLEKESAEKATADALSRAAMIAERAAGEAEAARVAKATAEHDAIVENAYENSFGKHVPVITSHGKGTVVSYGKETGMYTVELSDLQEETPIPEDSNESKILYIEQDELELDDSRIISPRRHVDTPFGLGEVIGLDPHAGCYAVRTETVDDGIAYVQIPDVRIHKEKKTSVILDEDKLELEVPEEIGLSMARIVDSRVVSRTGKRFVQYKLEIQTTNFGTLYCWKRYSTFRLLCERLRKEKGFKRKEIPDLPSRHILGNFSQKTIGERAEKLNGFLEAACHAEHLQWGIRVDDEISVYKRRVKTSKSKKKQRG